MKHLLLTTAAVCALSGTVFAETTKNAITNEEAFRVALSRPGTLSLKESQLATGKATNVDVKEFAMFETDEQSTIATILKELNTPDAELTEKDEAVLNQLKEAKKGKAFDVAYVNAQTEGHQELLSITESYISNSDAQSSNPKEVEARHLAMLARSTIKQHIANTRKLSSMLK